MTKIKRIKVYIIAVLLIIVDQLVKLIVLNNIQKFPIQFIKNFLTFTYCENRGVAFSIGEGNVLVFIIINVILIGALVWYYEKNKSNLVKGEVIFYSATIAGGIGNLIDRIFRGFVVDYIDVSELIKFPIFNLADIFICIGIVGLAIFYLIKSKD